MLKRRLSPVDPACAMLCLTRLLDWRNDPVAREAVPPLIFGPFYLVVEWFTHATLDAVPWCVDWTNYVWRPLPPWTTHPIARATAWRLSMLWHYINNHSLLRACFPLDTQDLVLPHLMALVDSMHPLVTHLETCQTEPTLASLTTDELLPEQCRGRVIDATCLEEILGHFIPAIFTGTSMETWFIPDHLFRALGLDISSADDRRSIQYFYGLLRRTLFRKTGLRSFLGVLHGALALQTPDWLSHTLVLMFKCVLLGAYPGARECMGWADRHRVYQWTWEDMLGYFRCTVVDARPTDKDVDTRVAMVMLAQCISIFFHEHAPTSVACRQFVAGWDAFKLANDHLLQVILRVFPAPPDHASVNMSYKDVPLLSLRYANSVYALGSKNKQTLKGRWATLHELEVDWHTVTTLSDLILVLVECDGIHGDASIIMGMQRAYDIDGTVTVLESGLGQLTASCRERLLSLCAWIVRRRIFQVTPINHWLALQQQTRLLEVDPGLRPHDACLVLHCRECDTVRFKPVGPKMPSSYVTVQVRMHWMRISCMECNSTNLEAVNLLGAQVRCLLNPKSKPGVQQLAVCSSCQHIMALSPDYFVNGGPICIECFAGTTALISVAAANPVSCINACTLPMRTHGRIQRFFLQDPITNGITATAICASCMPLDLRSCANTVTRYTREELQSAINFKLSLNARVQYNTRLKHNKKPPGTSA